MGRNVIVCVQIYQKLKEDKEFKVGGRKGVAEKSDIFILELVYNLFRNANSYHSFFYCLHRTCGANCDGR